MTDLLMLAQEAAPVVSSEHPLAQFLSRIDGGNAFVVAIMVVACLTAITITLITSLSSLFKTWRVARIRGNLIQDMLDRGLSPADIQDLVALTQVEEGGRCGQRSTPPRQRASDIPPAKPIITSR